MDLFFNEHLNFDTAQIEFAGEEFHHIIKVMRFSIGQKICITNGRGLISSAVIKEILKDRCKCEIESIKVFHKPELKIAALVPVLKSLERFEFALEKLTELGVDEIQPFFSENSVKKNFRYERSKKILISAVKQSFNPFLPELKELISFEKYFSLYNNDCLLLYGKLNGKNLYQIFKEFDFSSVKKIIIAVGPEGDFSSDELKILETKNGVPVSLGTQRLRSETAAVCLLAQLKLFVNLR